MPDVGEVRYKAVVDDSGIDGDIRKTEEKIKKAAKSSESAVKNAADNSKSAVKSASDSSGGAAQNAAKKTESAAKAAKDTVRSASSAASDAVDASADGAKSAAKEAAESAKNSAKGAGKKVREESQKTKEQTEKDSEESSKKFSLNWKSAGATAAKAIGAAAVTIGAAAATGIAALGKVGVEYNAQMEQYRTAFTTMLGDADKADALTESLKDLAAATPLAMTDLADASKILLAFGSSADELPEQLKRLGDVSQGNAEKLGTMATAFGRIQSNGYASLEEINMMIDQGFNPLQIIADKTGESMAELRDRVSDGGVSFEELSDALVTATSKGGQFYNAMDAQSKTLTGRWSTLQDDFAAFAGEITEGVTPALLEAMDMLTGLFDDGSLKSALTDIFDGISQIVTEALPVFVDLINQLAPTMGEITENLLPVLATLFEELVPPLMELVAAVLPVLSELLTTLVPPLAEIIEAIMPILVSLLGALMPILSMALDLVTLLLGVIVDLLQPITDLIMQGVTPLIDILTLLTGATLQPLIEVLKVLLSTAVGIFEGIKNTIMVAVNNVIGVLRGLIDFVTGAFTGNWERAWDGIQRIFGAIFQGLVGLAKSPINGIIDAINGFINGVNQIRIPDWVPNVGGLSISIPLIPRLKKGMPFVPKDFYPAYLDYGERVLTREENLMLNSIGGFSAVRQAAQATADSATRAGSLSRSTRIEVPVSIDGREVARATAWYMGEELAWEER